jgi:hypothetical protein
MRNRVFKTNIGKRLEDVFVLLVFSHGEILGSGWWNINAVKP